MRNIFAFTVRNTKLFLRDRATLFFSVLSSLIIIMLYFLFIGKIYIDGINQILTSISVREAGYMVYLQMIAGVLVLNSISLSLGMFIGAAKDFESQRLDSFSITPIKKHEIIISYYAGGITVSFLLNLFAWIVSAILIGLITGYWIRIISFLLAIAILLFASVISASIMMLLTVITKSSAALGVINGILGTFLGFVCGIYMPYSNLGEGIKALGSFFPFSHLTILFKKVVLNDAFLQIGISKEAKDILLKELFSASNIGFCGGNVPLTIMLLYSGVFAVICLLISAILLKKRIRNKA